MCEAVSSRGSCENGDFSPLFHWGRSMAGIAGMATGSPHLWRSCFGPAQGGWKYETELTS